MSGRRRDIATEVGWIATPFGLGMQARAAQWLRAVVAGAWNARSKAGGMAAIQSLNRLQTEMTKTGMIQQKAALGSGKVGIVGIVDLEMGTGSG